MKVILTQEVKGKGGEGDVIDVAAGYAVNFLFPRKMAIDATAGNLKQLELRKHNIRTREEGRLADASAAAAALEGKIVTIEAKVGEEGRLFGSITAQMIEDAIAEQLEVDVDRKKMDVHGSIKQTGQHPVSVHVYRDVKATVLVNVVGEGGVMPVAAEPAAPVEAAAESEALDAEIAEEVAEEIAAEELAAEAVEDAEEIVEDGEGDEA